MTTINAFNQYAETRIAVKNYKTIHGMEGGGYSGTIYFDGKAVCIAEDTGDGGPVNYYPVKKGDARNALYSNESFLALKAYCEAFAPVYAFGSMLPMNMDIIIGEMCNLQFFAKQLARCAKKNLCYVKVGQEYGSFYEIPVIAEHVDQLKAALDAKFGAGNWLMLANPRDGVCIDPEYIKIARKELA